MLEIYILNYNYGQYIKDCVASLLEQDDRDFSVICIDNGSCDGSDVFLQETCAQQGWRFFSFANLPISHIGNFVLNNSQAEYITRLDADDTLRSNYVAAVKAEIAKTRADVIYGNYSLMDYDGVVFSEQDILERGRNAQGRIHDEPFHGACTAIKRSELAAVGGYYEQFTCQDGFDLYLKFRGKPMSKISAPLFNYRRGHRSLSYNRSRLFQTRIKMMQAYCRDFDVQPGRYRHVLAFPNQPGFLDGKRLEALYDHFSASGLPFTAILRDPAPHFEQSVPWAQVMHSANLREFLLNNAQFEDVDTFVIHSLNGKLAPLAFFEIAPYLPELFCSQGAISGIRVESSIYTAEQGGVVKSGLSSRKLQEQGSSVLHAGGMTVFKRGSLESDMMTLLELSHDMLSEDYLNE